MGELTNLGHKYVDEETQEEKIIPRAKGQIEEYTYDTDTLQKNGDCLECAKTNTARLMMLRLIF